MKFTISSLKKFLETDASLEQIVEQLTNNGLEVEEVIDQASIYKPFIIAEIISAEPHPEADKLRICKINNGKEILQIVCGAPNARSGIKVVLAPIGAEIPSNGMKIKESKIRNQLSQGMLCSFKELNLGEDQAGIIELDEHYVVGNSFAKAYGLDDVLIEISITPNRGDCLGIYGIARDLSASGLGTLKPLQLGSFAGSFKSPLQVNLDSPHCLKYIGCYFKNIKNCQSPKWLEDFLKSIGQKPISALVDITNYFTFVFGRPLHVYDADLISSIEVREAKENEKFHGLNEKQYNLKGGELVIADKDKIIGMAGALGDKTSSVTLETKNSFLEIGLFDSIMVAKSARLHQIDTDAKYRFERKLDPEFMEKALSLASAMILEICGGAVSYPIKLGKFNFKPILINFNINDLEKVIGISYPKNRVIEILTMLGFGIEDRGEILNLSVPSWRNDIQAKEDVIEEIARIDGYNKIPFNPLPYRKVTLDMKQRNFFRVGRYAASLGLNEVITWSFMPSKQACLFGDLKDELFLKNPISSELDYMRASILPNLLDVVERNQNRGLKNLKIFEQGPIFKGLSKEEQFLTLSGLRSGLNNEKNHYKDSRIVDVFDAKSDIFNILSELGSDPYKMQYITDNLPRYYHPGRAAAFALGKNIIGYFGELHPEIVKNYNIEAAVVGFEIFLDNVPVAKAKQGRKQVLQISNYQAVERDFAFIIDKSITINKIIKQVEQVDKKLVRSVAVFDIYAGKGIDEDKRSIAFNIIIQSDDSTLTENEIEEISNKVIETMSKNFNAILRNS